MSALTWLKRKLTMFLVGVKPEVLEKPVKDAAYFGKKFDELNDPKSAARKVADKYREKG